MSDHSSSNLSRPASPISPLPPTARPYRFNWDPAQRGPESVSGTTEGRDHFAGPSRLNLFNNSSATLGLGALPPQWSSSTHGFHAISTVLNNPHKRQAPPKAHSSLPAVAPADLPRVRRKDFDSYLNAITPEWERLEHNNQVNRDAELQLEGTSTPRAAQPNGSFVQTPGRPLPPLDVVPSVFFEPTFNLGDPRTFNAVTEQDSPHHDPTADPTALSYSLPLLEKFSHYADTVEQHLVREISLRSASFFAALTNLHELQSESEECLDRISKLRTLLKDVDEKGAKKGLEVVRKEGRMRNIGKVREGVKFVGGIVEMTSVAKGLVAAGQWDQALGVLEEMERLWEAPPDSEPPPPTPTLAKFFPHTKAAPNAVVPKRLSSLPPTPEERLPISPDLPPPIIPLSSLTAFSALPTHLRTLTLEITSSLSIELVSVLRVDLLERISGSPDDGNDSLKDRLRPLLHGLTRTKGVREATLSWREVALDEIRGVIRRHIPAFDITDEESRPAGTSGGENTPRPGLASHMRDMPHSDFLELIQNIYKSFLNAVQGLHSQGVAFLEVLEITNSKSPLNITALQDEFSDILSSAAELSNTQAAKLVILRAEQHAALSLSEFFTFFNDSWSFVVKCEVICRKMIVGLRGVVISQSKTFLQAFHQARLTQSAALVENEQWEQIDATPAIQHVADVLVDSAVRDVPELLVAAPYRPFIVLRLTKNAKIRLRIEERTFSAVSATTEVLSLLLEYLRVIVNLSMLTTDTMSRVIEFLKAFNSRTCQVVLGAGAMRSAGLKNITAKHLGADRGFLAHYMRLTDRFHASIGFPIALDYDCTHSIRARDIPAGISARSRPSCSWNLTSSNGLSTHIRSFQAVDWSAPQEGVNAYMSVLVKETVTLHKVLSRHLSVAVVEDVMTQVFAAINHRLSEEYAKMVLPSEEVRKGLLADARFLHQKLSELKNVRAPSGMLEVVIAELRVPGAVSPSPSVTNFNTKPTANANADASANPRLLANRLRWNSLSANAIAKGNGNATPAPSPSPSVNGKGPSKSNTTETPAPSVNGTKSPPPPPPLLRSDSAGFRQVDPGSPRPESPRPESPLPALPPEALTSEPALIEDPLGVSTPTRGAHATPATPSTPTALASTPTPAPAAVPSSPLLPPVPEDAAPSPAPVQTATTDAMESPSPNVADNGIAAPEAPDHRAPTVPTVKTDATEPHSQTQDDSNPNTADNGIARPDRDLTDSPEPAA
ncbi:Vps54 domain-containing protein [Mycena sanguinolenta]|uniref:Vps54 domain-containing protein n=1 Tax=Mycena sanguinolenta TaxID=230812 RepID=A0A8H6YTN1_9AGAR|nr:Vps54 domain-containing protein [Mycena sanguinolenta]